MSIRILNWNTEWLGPGSRSGRFAKAKALIASYDPDVICLTEARPETMPELGQTIASELSGAGKIENRGGRKVVLWSRFGWSNVDTLGSSDMPSGRFIKTTTFAGGEQWTIIGMCVPYAHYRNHAKWGDQRKTFWGGACEYLDTLREEVLPRLREEFLPYSKDPLNTILLGDFNMQIPAFNYPYEGSEVNKKRKETFAGWLIPTAGISRHFIDHIAMSSELRVNSLQYISRFDSDGSQLSDHNGVCIDVTRGPS